MLLLKNWSVCYISITLFSEDPAVMSVDAVTVGNFSGVDVAATVTLVPDGLATGGTLSLNAVVKARSNHLLIVTLLGVDLFDTSVLVATVFLDAETILAIELSTLVVVSTVFAEDEGIVVWADEESIRLLPVEELQFGLKDGNLLGDLVLKSEDLSVLG